MNPAFPQFDVKEGGTIMHLSPGVSGHCLEDNRDLRPAVKPAPVDQPAFLEEPDLLGKKSRKE
jgi:hypothetical protein